MVTSSWGSDAFSIPPRAPEHLTWKIRKLAEVVSKATAERVAESRRSFDLELKSDLERHELYLRQLLNLYHLNYQESGAEALSSKLGTDLGMSTDTCFSSSINNLFCHVGNEVHPKAPPAAMLLQLSPDSAMQEAHTSFAEPCQETTSLALSAHSSQVVPVLEFARQTSDKSSLSLPSIQLSSPVSPRSDNHNGKQLEHGLDAIPEETDSNNRQFGHRPYGKSYTGESWPAFLDSITDENAECNGCEGGTNGINGTHSLRKATTREIEPRHSLSHGLPSSVVSKHRQSCSISELVSEAVLPSVTRLAWWRDIDDPDSSIMAYVYASAMNPFIFISVFVSVSTRFDPPLLSGDWVDWTQMMFDVLFALEVILRFCVAFQKIKFLTDPFNLIDMVAVLPLLVVRATEGFQLDARGNNLVVSLVRALGPVFKVCKVLRRFPTFHLLINAFSDAMEALPVLMFVFGLMGLTFASLIYVVEPRSNIDSFQQAIWLTVITMTTTGYGDAVPKTDAGKGVVSVLVVIQSLYMALPIGILGYEFTSTWKLRHRFLAVRLVKTRMGALGLGLRDVPRFFDYFGNADRCLDFYGFTEMIHGLGVNLGERRMREVYKGFDEDDSGAIDQMEFIMAVFPKEFKEAEAAKLRRDAEGEEPAYVVSSMRSIRRSLFVGLVEKSRRAGSFFMSELKSG